MSKIVLVSNLMMFKERERFENILREKMYTPVWTGSNQFLSEEECLNLVGDIDGWLAGDDRITLRVLEKATPRLRVISKWGTGLDSIDLEAAKILGIHVFNTPAAFANTVAEVAMGYMIALSRNLFEVDREIRNGGWPKPQGRELWGQTLGLIGFGAIGRKIGDMAAVFGMNVLFCDPVCSDIVPLVRGEARPVSLDELTRSSDVVCIACNYTPDNHHLVGESFLKNLKPSAMLINVSRGGIVDESALVSALKRGQLAKIGLDVFEMEPLPENSPLRTMGQVILGSHNANNGYRAVEAVHANTLKNLFEILK